MKSLFFSLGLTAVTAFYGTPSDASPTLATKAIEPREAIAAQYDKATQAQLNVEFTFDVTAKPTLTDHDIKLEGSLTNAGSQTQTAYLSTETPFVIELAPAYGVEEKPTTSKTPSLFVVDVPARTKVPFTARLPLSKLTYIGEPSVKLKWTFRFWVDPRPTGTAELKLPLRTSDALKLAIERFDNAQTKSAKLVATVTNVSPAPQLFCKQSVTWSDSSSTTESSPASTAAGECKVLNPQESFEVETATWSAGEVHAPRATLKNVRALKVQVENGATPDLASKYRAPMPILKTIEATTSL